MLSMVLNNNNNTLFSALEQFEIITYYYPGLESISNLISFFFPKEFLNNVNLSILMVFFYILALTDLKVNKIYLNDFSKNTQTETISVVTSLNSSDTLGGDSMLYFINSENKELTLEMMYLICMLFAFVKNQILVNLAYNKNLFLNYALTLFLFLLVCNIFGMIPYSLTATSYLVVTLNISGMSFFGNLILGLRIYRFHFFKFFMPEGVTGVLIVLMVVIETISYVARLFSMAIRLFANMLSGHALIKILSGLVFLTFGDIFFFGAINILFNVVVIAVTALEVIVAALQAYVFVILSVVYTNEAIVLH